MILPATILTHFFCSVSNLFIFSEFNFKNDPHNNKQYKPNKFCKLTLVPYYTGKNSAKNGQMFASNIGSLELLF